MRRIVGLMVVLALVGANVWAQDAEAGAAEPDALDRDVFAPFVSRLRVAVRDPEVRLTWRDSADLSSGLYRIYRHSSEITQNSLDDAQLIAEVPPGTETFLDTPPEEGQYFYAVLAAEPDGRLYPILVPFRNKTLRSVQITRLDSEEDRAARVYDIEAQAQDSALVLVFEPSRSDRSLAVYRSTQPFTDFESLSAGTLIAELPSSSRRFADYPVPGVSYYYGVFDTGLIELGSVQLEENENILTSPVGIALTSAETQITIDIPQASKRRAPLPILQLASGIQSGERLVRADIPGGGARPVPPATQSAIETLLARAPERAVFDPEPVILPREQRAEGEGVAITLAQIVTGEFSAGAYRSSIELLESLLNLPLSEQMEARVRFYLGQALFLDGRHEPAFLEFLLASGEPELYTAVRPWMEGILSGTGS